MQPWKTQSRKILLQHSKYLTVEEHTVELPDGRTVPGWPWVIVSDYVIVLARTVAGDFMLFRQVKYAVEGSTLAPVGGRLEPGEAPRAAAERELLEEMGCRAQRWADLGQYRVDGNHGCGTAHLFLADGAEQVQAPQSDDLEEQILLRMTLSEVRAALLAAEFKVLAWAAAVGLALVYLEGNLGEGQ